MRLKRDVLYFVIAISVLAVGLVFYVLGRSPGYVYFLPHGLGFGGTLHSVLAPLGNNLPTFVHTFAFILLTAAVTLPRTRGAALALSGVWLIAEALLELAQLPAVASRMAAAVPGWFAKVPMLDNTAAYFLHGTFDPLDLLSIVLGALAAYAMILIGLKREQQQDFTLLRPAPRSRLWLVPVAIAALVTTVASGGGGGGGSVGIGALDTNSHLYVAGNASNAILSFNNANTASGTISPTLTITSASLNGPRGIAVDMARNVIYVANTAGNSILIFINSRLATGNVTPARTITINGFSGPTALYLDVANDRLYVTNSIAPSVVVINNAHLANGNVAPSRTLAGTNTTLNSPDGVALDVSRNLLYVADAGTHNAVLVFNSADTVNGDIAPVGTIAGSLTTLSNPGGVFVDAQADRLYIANRGGRSVVIYKNASITSGNFVPTGEILITGITTPTPQDVFVDTGTDQLYVSDAANDTIVVFSNASTISGTVTPTPRAVNLPASTSPLGIFVDVTPIVLGSTATLDGYIATDGTIAGTTVSTDGTVDSPKTGDVSASGTFLNGTGARQFYSFDLTNFPSSVNVVSAFLHLYQANVQGLPYTSGGLGNVVVDHVNYGASLTANAYSALPLANVGTLSTDSNIEYKPLLSVMASVTSDVQSQSAFRASQYRLRFSIMDTNSNSPPNYVQFTDAEDVCCDQPPQLVITLVP